MREMANPLLQQVLHRRRILRRIRISVAAWAGFGGLHIAVWWAAFEQHRFAVPGALERAVWPLLLVATISFVAVVVNTARWFLAPANPDSYDWLERPDATSPTSPPIQVDVESGTDPALGRA